MNGADILEVFLGPVSVRINLNEGKAIDGLLSISWHHPRENVPSITSVVPLNGLTDNYRHDFSDAEYMDRILFKEQRRGTSFFTLELALVHDPGLFGKIINALLGVSIGKVPNRYLGAGLKPVLRELNLDEKQTTVIGVANYQLESDTKNTYLHIDLKTPRELSYYQDRPWEDFFDESEDDDAQMALIPKGTEIASVRLDLKELSEA